MARSNPCKSADRGALAAEAKAVALAQDRDRRFRRAEQNDLVLARLAAERRDPPVLIPRQAMGGARQSARALPRRPGPRPKR